MASAASTGAPLVKEAALARQLGVSRQSINELVKRGVISKNADGLIDAEMARIAIANRVRPSSKTSQALTTPGSTPASSTEAATPAGDVMSYHVAKTLREAAEAAIAQLKLAELRGDLMRTDAVHGMVAKLAAGLREGLLQIPPRLAPVLAAEADAAIIQETLAAALRGVLEQVTTTEAPQA